MNRAEPSEFPPALIKRIAETLTARPVDGEILLIGACSRQLLKAALTSLGEDSARLVDSATTLDMPAPDELAALVQTRRRFAVAYVVNTLEHLDQTRGEQLIAALRDTLCTAFYLIISARHDEPRTQWCRDDLIALGLRRDAGYDDRENDAHHALYGFDIDDYKATPDWLNADHWANPHRFGKDRW